VHPLDTFKTVLQTRSSLRASHAALTTPSWSGLLRGFQASVLGAAPQGALRLATYELVKSYLLHLPPPSSSSSRVPDWIPHLNPVPASALAATCGDLASSLAKLPREVITTRLQASQTEQAVRARHVVLDIVRQRGLRGLFHGFTATTVRDVPFMVILFTTYESFKEAHQRIWVGQGVPSLTSTLFGGTSGALAAWCTTPMDVLKTQIMIRGNSNMRSEYKRLLADSQGKWTTLLSNAWRGSIARSVWWFAICSLFFPAYESSKNWLDPIP